MKIGVYALSENKSDHPLSCSLPSLELYLLKIMFFLPDILAVQTDPEVLKLFMLNSNAINCADSCWYFSNYKHDKYRSSLIMVQGASSHEKSSL